MLFLYRSGAFMLLAHTLLGLFYFFTENSVTLQNVFGWLCRIPLEGNLPLGLYLQIITSNLPYMGIVSLLMSYISIRALMAKPLRAWHQFLLLSCVLSLYCYHLIHAVQSSSIPIIDTLDAPGGLLSEIAFFLPFFGILLLLLNLHAVTREGLGSRISILLGSFRGRLNLGAYWLWQVVFLGGFTLVNVLLAAYLNDYHPILMGDGKELLIVKLHTALVTFWPSLALGAKRCHDRNKSGWFQLIGLIPLVNIWYYIEMYLLKGYQGETAFAPLPATPDHETEPVVPAPPQEEPSCAYNCPAGGQSAPEIPAQEAIFTPRRVLLGRISAGLILLAMLLSAVSSVQMIFGYGVPVAQYIQMTIEYPIQAFQTYRVTMWPVIFYSHPGALLGIVLLIPIVLKTMGDKKNRKVWQIYPTYSDHNPVLWSFATMPESTVTIARQLERFNPQWDSLLPITERQRAVADQHYLNQPQARPTPVTPAHEQAGAHQPENLLVLSIRLAGAVIPQSGLNYLWNFDHFQPLFPLVLPRGITDHIFPCHHADVLVQPGLNCKRLHDRNKSGWYQLVLGLPLVNLWILVELMFLAGTPATESLREQRIKATGSGTRRYFYSGRPWIIGL